MDDPVQEITPIVHRLTQGSPAIQEQAINDYFTPNASFTHPFCRTGSFEGSRYLIHAIFRWYKILSPHIDLTVKSVAFDETNLLLYLTISQTFSIWLIPFHRSPVALTTVLQLVRLPASSTSSQSSYSSARMQKYYIASQNDLYQTDQFIRFVTPWSMGAPLVILWQFFATACCVIGAVVGQPFTKFMQWYAVKQEGEKETEPGRMTMPPMNGDATYEKRLKALVDGVGSANGDSSLLYGNGRSGKLD